MQSKQIGRHLKRIAQARVAAGPVVVDLLEKRYPKYGFLGRQALAVMEAFREEGKEEQNSPPTSGEYYPSSPLAGDDLHAGQQVAPAMQKDALGKA